jgi:TM2 domain-containing membrane protein YozV
MSKAWKNLNLEGGGLQAVNAVLAANLRSRRRTYAAWLLFPLGLHRWYLGDRRGATLFLLLSALALTLAAVLPGYLWLVPLAGLLGLAAFDLFRIEDRVVAYNKELRMRLFLRKGQRTPDGYRGRYPEPSEERDARTELASYAALKEQERAGHPARHDDGSPGAHPAQRRIPSFNEQEALLRQLSNRGKGGD